MEAKTALEDEKGLDVGLDELEEVRLGAQVVHVGDTQAEHLAPHIRHGAPHIQRREARFAHGQARGWTHTDRSNSPPEHADPLGGLRTPLSGLSWCPQCSVRHATAVCTLPGGALGALPPSLRGVSSRPQRPYVRAYSTRVPFKAYEDTSEVKARLADVWVPPERPGHVLPTYQLLDETGRITNEAEFPSEVRPGLCVRLSSCCASAPPSP